MREGYLAGAEPSLLLDPRRGIVSSGLPCFWRLNYREHSVQIFCSYGMSNLKFYRCCSVSNIQEAFSWPTASRKTSQRVKDSLVRVRALDAFGRSSHLHRPSQVIFRLFPQRPHFPFLHFAPSYIALSSAVAPSISMVAEDG